MKEKNMLNAFRMQFLEIFGEENLSLTVYDEAIFRWGISFRMLALRKLLNPFKWLEFGLSLISFLSQIIPLAMFILMTIAVVLTTLAVALISCFIPLPLLEWLPLLITGICLTAIAIYSKAFRITIDCIRCITSPINSFFNPLINYFQNKPAWKSALLITTALALASVFIISIIFSGGLAALPGALLFLQPLVTLFSPAIAFIAQAMGLAAAQTLLSVAVIFASFTAVRHLFRIKDDMRKIGNEAFKLKLPPKGIERAIEEEAAIDSQGQRYNNQPDFSNAYSRLLYNSPKRSGVVSPEQQGIAFSFKKFFGWNPKAPDKFFQKATPTPQASSDGGIKQPQLTTC